MILLICKATKKVANLTGTTQVILGDCCHTWPDCFCIPFLPYLIVVHSIPFLLVYHLVLTLLSWYNNCSFVFLTQLSYLLLRSIHSYTRQVFGLLLITKKNFILKIHYVKFWKLKIERRVNSILRQEIFKNWFLKTILHCRKFRNFT